MRLLATSLALLLAAGTLAQAGDDGVAGNWKLSIIEDGQQIPLWIVRLANKDGKLTGQTVPLRRVPASAVSDLKVTGDRLTFAIKLGNTLFNFETRLPAPGGKKMYGSVARGGQMNPVILEATTATTPLELDKELVTRNPTDPRVFGAVQELVKEAAENKTPAAEVKTWVQAALKAGEAYGPRWQTETALRLAETLLAQPGQAEIAVEAVRSAEKALGAQAPVESRLRLMSVLAGALKKAGQANQAKLIEAQLDQLEGQAHAEYEKTALPFPVMKFPGRKGPGDRAVLVELFTGAQCPPCVAADLAFDATDKAYKPSDVVLLQYHLHIPGPDALTNRDSEARQEYYGPKIRGTPTVLFNGKVGAPGGGGRDDAEDKFKEFQEVINPSLESPAKVNIQASAKKQGTRIAIQASAKNLDKPSDKVRLRLALVEDWARYKGRNGLTYHSRVVRALPGGPAGFALDKKDSDHTASVDLDELRTQLSKYLDDYAKTEEPFPDAQRPLSLRNLSVVAFVQNDETGEVLQAIEVPIKE